MNTRLLVVVVLVLFARSIQAAEPSTLRYVGKSYSDYGGALKQQIVLYHVTGAGRYVGKVRCRGKRCLVRSSAVAVTFYVDYTFAAVTNYCDVWGTYSTYSISGSYDCYNGDSGTLYARRTR